MSSDSSATTSSEGSSKFHQMIITGAKNDLYDLSEEIITAKEKQNLTKDENNTNDNGMGKLLSIEDTENVDVLFEDQHDTTNTDGRIAKDLENSKYYSYNVGYVGILACLVSLYSSS